MIERAPLDQRTERAEWMPEGAARLRPIAELRAEAVGGLGLVDEIVLIDAEESQELEHGRLRRLCLSRNDGFGSFDDVYRTMSTEAAAKHDGREPTGNATADDGDAPDSSIRFHCVPW